MSAGDRLIQRFGELPRSARWLAWAVAGIGLFLAWDSLLRPAAAGWNEQADKLLLQFREAVKSPQRNRSAMELQDEIRGLGPLEPPDEQSRGDLALHRAVNDVLASHSASEADFSVLTPERLQRGMLTELIEPGRRVVRLTADLRFVASPDEASAIIAALEQRPEIEAISSLRITRHVGARKVSVDLTLDAWVITSEESRGLPGRRGGVP